LREVAETNPDVVVAIAEAVNRRDLDALMTHLDEDIEHRDAQLSTVRHGREAIRQHFLELWREHPDASFRVDEVVAEGDWVVVRQDWRGLADGELTTWVARRLVNGKVREIDVCSTRAQALRAAGVQD
jgi:ketosteroid isomerase-like protein